MLTLAGNPPDHLTWAVQEAVWFEGLRKLLHRAFASSAASFAAFELAGPWVIPEVRFPFLPKRNHWFRFGNVGHLLVAPALKRRRPGDLHGETIKEFLAKSHGNPADCLVRNRVPIPRNAPTVRSSFLLKSGNLP